MKRLETHNFVNTLHRKITLEDKEILEIGCGNGHYTNELVMYSTNIVAIDPNKESIALAKKRDHLKELDFRVGTATNLEFKEGSFDVVIFTLSLHHVPILEMETAISEAVRVVRKNGYVVFLEPGFSGSFFTAEIIFDACDGDENKEKRAARSALGTSIFLDSCVSRFTSRIFK